MRSILLAVLVVLGLPVQAQEAPDTLVSYYNNSRAFLWPQPFAHVPQTFEAQAVRFTAPYGGPLISSKLEAIELRVDETSRSQDNFNDILRLSFLYPDPNGRPDSTHHAGEPLEIEFAELVPGEFNTILIEPFPVYLQRAQPDVWVVFELIPNGTPDELVLVSGPRTDPPLFRAAARVEGQGWLLLHETQFGAEFNYHVGARFIEFIHSSVENPERRGQIAVTLAPQPARDGVTLTLHDLGAQAGTAEVFDVLGRRVFTAEVPAGAQTVRLDTRALPAGLYDVQVAAGPHRATRPLVVVR